MELLSLLKRESGIRKPSSTGHLQQPDLQNRKPFLPRPDGQSVGLSLMFKPGWHIGAHFRCHVKRGFHHRVYEGPLDGTPRVRLGPEEITVDFSTAFRIKALFCNETFSAVQFKAQKTLEDGSTRSMKFWTNVRRGGEWWADIVHPSGTDSCTADETGRIGEAILITPKLRSVSSHRVAPSTVSNSAD